MSRDRLQGTKGVVYSKREHFRTVWKRVKPRERDNVSFNQSLYFKRTKETICFYWLTRAKLEEKLMILGFVMKSLYHMRHIIIVVFYWYHLLSYIWYAACLIYCILYTVVCNILFHIFNQERGCVIFRSHGSKFADIIQPICKTKRQITVLDWFQQVRICILVIFKFKSVDSGLGSNQ